MARMQENIVHNAPLEIEDEDAPDFWDESTDLLVVGFGVAGAAAALEAREQGAEVIVLDRFAGGGATAYSGGVYYAGNTQYQRDAGFDDSAEEMFKYLSIDVGDAVKPETLRRFCDDSPDNIAWITRHGVPFEGSAYLGKRVFPPAGKRLYYSGNEKVPAYAARAKPAPRGHQTVGKGNFCGYAFFGALEAATYRSGAKVLTHSWATRLVRNHAGRIVGVEMRGFVDPADQKRHQKLYSKINPHKPFGSASAEKAIARARAMEAQYSVRRLIRARRGVVLSTGGFIYNLEMLNAYLPDLAGTYKTLMRLGSMGCDGSGIAMGQSVGASVAYMERPFISHLLNPPDAKTYGLIVNGSGDRFINEDIYCSVLGDAILAQPGMKAWLVLDHKTFWTVVRQSLANKEGTFTLFGVPTLLNILLGRTRRARSLEKLGARLGIPPGRLSATVARFNDHSLAGRPDPLGKNAEYVRPLGEGPYWALDISLRNVFAFSGGFTLGGLKVDEVRGTVVDTTGHAIEGLYGAGRAAVGLCSNGYFSGLSLADGVFSGRRAARDALAPPAKAMPAAKTKPATPRRRAARGRLVDRPA